VIDALVGGKLHAKPQQRTGQSGRPFTTAKLIVSTGNGESLFVSVVAFADHPQAALLALDAGDSVAVAGPLAVRAFVRENEPRPSVDVIAQSVLTPFHVKRKQRAVEEQHS